MYPKGRVYSVLIVSASEGFNDALKDMLPEADYVTYFESSISSAQRCFAERSFDYVIINSPLPDDIGARFAIDCCNSSGTVVLLMIREELYARIHEKVAEHGVFTLPKPLSKPSISMALSWMASARERLRKNEKKTFTLEEKMEEIRIVNRAKWLLISELRMDEQSAHKYIEKQAMNNCVSKRTIAEGIIRTYS